MTTDELDLTTAALPEAVRAWLHEQPAVVVVIERVGEQHAHVRRIPDVDVALLARIGVTMAKYREALMNLT